MADVECQLCGRPDPERAYVCADCARPVQRALEAAARLGGDAGTTIARQAVLGRSGGVGDGLPFSWEAADATWCVANTLTTWARHIAGERGRDIPAPPGPVQGPLCRGVVSCRHRSCTQIGTRAPLHPLSHLALWLADQVTWLRHRPEAAEALDELGYAAHAGERTVDNPPDRWYAGRCYTDLLGGDSTLICQAELYPPAGARLIRCPECGTVHDADARRSWLLGEAKDQLLPASLVAGALTVLLGRTITAARVRGLAHRGRIVAHGCDVDGREQYRVGDVLAVVEDQDRERASAAT